MSWTLPASLGAALAAALALAGCQRELATEPPATEPPTDAPAATGPAGVPPAAPSPLPTGFRCDGGAHFEARFEDSIAIVTFEGEESRLSQVEAASGARYTGTRADGMAIELWTKGDEAIFRTGDREFSGCKVESAKASPWFARGNEPFWLIRMEGDTLHWETPGSEPVVWTGLTRSERADSFDLHAVRESHHLSVSATASVCRDSMAGMPYPHTVVITLDGERLSGCGGDPMSLLAIGEWTVASVGGEPTGERPPTLQFLPEGRAAGFAGCNRWMGNAGLSGEGLAFTQAATTMMACPEPAMAAERRFLDALSKITRHDFGADGSLQLIAGDTVLIVATPPARS